MMSGPLLGCAWADRDPSFGTEGQIGIKTATRRRRLRRWIWIWIWIYETVRMVWARDGRLCPVPRSQGPKVVGSMFCFIRREKVELGTGLAGRADPYCTLS